MLVQLRPGADSSHVRSMLARMGLWSKPLSDESGTIKSIEIVAPSPQVSAEALRQIEGVDSVLDRPSPHPLLDGIDVNTHTLYGLPLDGSQPLLFAGPCSIENEARVHRIAQDVAKVGAHFLRGGAFKPRTSPYEFSGLGAQGLNWMRSAADANGLKVVTEVLSERDVELVATHADLLQIGSRNMQNFALLRAVGSMHKPVLLKRGRAATIDEWILAGEHCMAAGAPLVVFCERGVRGFDSQMRNLLDLGSVAVLRHQHNLPVIVDPSHATGRKDLINPLSNAAFAAGACGVMVEYHPEPEFARSDAAQAIDFNQLSKIASDNNISTADQQ
jgi:3-deoxy-7-phosphoheptulonate synthase